MLTTICIRLAIPNNRDLDTWVDTRANEFIRSRLGDLCCHFKNGDIIWFILFSILLRSARKENAFYVIRQILLIFLYLKTSFGHDQMEGVGSLSFFKNSSFFAADLARLRGWGQFRAKWSWLSQLKNLFSSVTVLLFWELLFEQSYNLSWPW